MAEEVQYRSATRDDLPGIAEVFQAAFPESVQHYVGHPIPPDVFADIFAICLDAEPEALFTATVGARTAGYIFAPMHLTRLFRTALWRGHLLRLFWGWASGRYRLGWQPVRIAMRNMLSVYRDAKAPELFSDARIFSVAVHPDFQGRGVGGGLLRVGLAYLEAQGARSVRLEVRPHNAAAVHLYEKFGFSTRGMTHDTQGEWLIMVREPGAQG